MTARRVMHFYLKVFKNRLFLCCPWKSLLRYCVASKKEATWSGKRLPQSDSRESGKVARFMRISSSLNALDWNFNNAMVASIKIEFNTKKCSFWFRVSNSMNWKHQWFVVDQTIYSRFISRRSEVFYGNIEAVHTCRERCAKFTPESGEILRDFLSKRFLISLSSCWDQNE